MPSFKPFRSSRNFIQELQHVKAEYHYNYKEKLYYKPRQCKQKYRNMRLP